MGQTNSTADYKIRFSAADPAKYAALTVQQYLSAYGAFPTAGNLDGSAARALAGSDADLHSLAPQKSNPILGQIVVWDVVIEVASGSKITNGAISVSLDWGLATTSGADYGFDASRGVLAAYVDTSAAANTDRDSAATVTGKSSGTVTSANGDRWLRGDISVGGLDAGDKVTLEVWTVLRPDSTGKFTGVVQSQLAQAATSDGVAIDVGTQTIPLKIDGFGGLSISGTAFEDKDSDGALDNGEAGLAGWTVTLTGPDGKTLTDTTDAKGAYAFTGLVAGTYTITQTLRDGYALSAPVTKSHTVTLGAADLAGLDFGNVQTGRIAGTVYGDSNASKAIDAADAKLAGITVFLDANGNGKLDTGEAQTKTDASGAYAFTGLAAGSYSLAEVLPGGATQLLAPGKVVLGYGQSVTGKNFLNSVGGALYGTKDAETIRGSSGDDTISGNDGADLLDGRDGNDSVIGGSQSDTLLGGNGDDRIFGHDGNDVMNGGSGADRLYGNNGNDTINGDDAGTVPVAGISYDDLIEAGTGNDLINGGLGNDEMQGEDGNDTITGGKDDGKLVYANTAKPAAGAPAQVVIGDNLYGNGGSDLYLYGKGDGVDLIWDFDGSQDTIKVSGYKLADVDAFTFVSTVIDKGRSNGYGLDAGTHKKLAVILDTSGDAIIFIDFASPASTRKVVQFDDASLSAADLFARATAGALPPGTGTVVGNDITAKVAVTQSWWGGFQGEVTVTAKHELADWSLNLGSKYQLGNVAGAKIGGVATQSGGFVYSLADADWNGHLGTGQSATIQFTVTTGIAGVLDAAKLPDALWIA